MNAESQEPDRTVRRRALCHGRVQGVGFRMTAASIAKRFSVVGYVKNLRDGTVELVAEGDLPIVEQFFDEVAEAFAGNITDLHVNEFDSPEFFANFRVRY